MKKEISIGDIEVESKDNEWMEPVYSHEDSVKSEQSISDLSKHSFKQRKRHILN